jgi:AcrR family transcriptional regulator
VNGKGERGQLTRKRILDCAARLFAEAGYEDTSIEAVLRESGISRGALYHHFENKEALFSAVLEATEARVAETVACAAQGLSDPLEALRAGCEAWLRLAAGDPAVRRIVLVDAPAVVGWQAWREIDGRHAMGLLRSALSFAAGAGRMPRENVDLYAHLLLAMLIEAALLVARSDDGDRTIAASKSALDRILGSLLGAPAS